LAAKNATQTIPIVMVAVGDPVGSGLVVSLAHPGGNITGPSSMFTEMAAKQLELLKETVPKVSRVAVLWNPANPVWQGQMLRATEVAARALGLRLHLVEASGPAELDVAFAAMTREAAGALLVQADPMLNLYMGRIADLAAKQRLPAMHGSRENVVAGGLMSYGPNFLDLFHRA